MQKQTISIIASGAVLMLVVGLAGFRLMSHDDEIDIQAETTTTASETTTTTTETETSTTDTTTTTATTSTTDTTTTTTSITTVETTVTTKPSTTTEVKIETKPETTTVATTTTEIDIPEESTVVETETETTTETVVTEAPAEEFVGTFTRGTYYTFGNRGGSGRTLVSGYSIASRALYEMYGYGDHKFRIECDEFPDLNGVYSLDDCSAKGDNRVVDFWFAPGDVPAYFRQMGVLEVRVYIIHD